MNHMAAQLPPYSVPSKVRVMETFPRTSTGKINRRELEALAAAEVNATA
jgi:acyl-coenzyme A synthetase/AMP-(fatty) acid ligase